MIFFTLSIAEANALPLTLEPVALGELVQEVGLSLQPLAQRERRISVVTRFDADLPPVTTDRQRVVQILGNLVRNSLRQRQRGA